MPGRTAALVVALVLPVIAAGPARGQSAEVRPPAADEREQRARRLFREGSQLYDQAQYDEAVARFEEAYRLSSLPALVFNTAKAYRLRGPGECATALRYYERYLREDPGASNRQEIEELIEEMRLCTAAQNATTSPVATVPPPIVTAPPAGPSQPAARPIGGSGRADGESPASADRPRWPRRGAVAGGAILLLGLGGYSAALLKYDAVKDHGPYPPGRFRNWEIVTDISYGLMAAGAATGLVSALFLVRHDARSPRVAVSLGCGPSFRLGGQF